MPHAEGETQNTNVPACRFYRRMGCSLGANRPVPTPTCRKRSRSCGSRSSDPAWAPSSGVQGHPLGPAALVVLGYLGLLNPPREYRSVQGISRWRRVRARRHVPLGAPWHLPNASSPLRPAYLALPLRRLNAIHPISPASVPRSHPPGPTSVSSPALAQSPAESRRWSRPENRRGLSPYPGNPFWRAIPSSMASPLGWSGISGGYIRPRCGAREPSRCSPWRIRQRLHS